MTDEERIQSIKSFVERIMDNPGGNNIDNILNAFKIWMRYWGPPQKISDNSARAFFGGDAGFD